MTSVSGVASRRRSTERSKRRQGGVSAGLLAEQHQALGGLNEQPAVWNAACARRVYDDAVREPRWFRQAILPTASLASKTRANILYLHSWLPVYYSREESTGTGILDVAY